MVGKIKDLPGLNEWMRVSAEEVASLDDYRRFVWYFYKEMCDRKGAVKFLDGGHLGPKMYKEADMLDITVYLIPGSVLPVSR